MAEIVDAAQRFDARRGLGGFPVAVAEVVEVEVTAAGRREEKLTLTVGSDLVERASAIACNGTARMLPSVFVLLSRPFLSARRT